MICKLFCARCISQPWKAYPMLLVFAFAVLQLSSVGSTGLVSEIINREAAMQLSVCFLVGSGMSLFGLHWRDYEMALWIELAGYVSLVGAMGLYCALQLMKYWPNTNIGLALSVAVVLAALHHGVQIVVYKRRRHRSDGTLDTKALQSLIAMEKRYL